MKKFNLLASLFLCLAIAAPTLTASELGSEATEEERAIAYWNLGTIAVVNGGLYSFAEALGLSVPTQAILHVSSVLYNGGQLFDQPAYRDLGVRVALLGLSAKITSSGVVQNMILPALPLGQKMKDAGDMGKFVVGYVIYELIGIAYGKIKEKSGLGETLGLNVPQ